MVRALLSIATLITLNGALHTNVVHADQVITEINANNIIPLPLQQQLHGQYHDGYPTVSQIPSGPRTQQASNFKLLTPEEIHHTLLLLAVQHPRLTTLTTAQEAFGLPPTGQNPTDCPYTADGGGCLTPILTIEDKVAHGNETGSSTLPEVLLIGALNGRDRVGPTALIETARLLLLAAHCTATDPESRNSDSLRKDGNGHQPCDAVLEERYGMTPPLRRWLARLVATRRIVMIPTANSLGYFRDVSFEEWEESNGVAGVGVTNRVLVDPTRDFPYDLKGAACFRSVATRTVNMVTRQHLFQMGMVLGPLSSRLGPGGGEGGFVSGEGVYYPWGSPSHGTFRSPDEESLRQVASSVAGYAFGRTGRYEVGTVLSLIHI